MTSTDPADLNVKITDFGFAKCYDPDHGLKDTLGSPLYMAPEIVKKVPYNEKVDIWSLGVLAYVLLSGKPPFLGRSKDELFIAITSSPLLFSESIWLKVSTQCKTFIKSMLTREVDLRASAEELIESDWLQIYADPKKIPEEQILDVALHLQDFKKKTVFQQGVMAFILSFTQSHDDLDELRQIFLKLDKSNDGVLSTQEIQEGLKQVMGVKGSNTEYEALLQNMDMDRNGHVDYSEFLTAAVNKNQLLSRGNLETAYKLFDVDKNGTVTVDEVKQVFDFAGQKDQKLWKEIMEEVDTNKDNIISFDEFINNMEKVMKGSYSELNQIISAGVLQSMKVKK